MASHRREQQVQGRVPRAGGHVAAGGLQRRPHPHHATSLQVRPPKLLHPIAHMLVLAPSVGNLNPYHSGTESIPDSRGTATRQCIFMSGTYPIAG